MKHKELLKTVSAEFETETGKSLSIAEIDSLIESYFSKIYENGKKQIEEQDGLRVRSKSIANKNLGTFWVRKVLGDNGKNGLGQTERAFYMRLKTRFSPVFYRKFDEK